MARECQRRRKLTQLIRDFALMETTEKRQVPVVISEYILEPYGLKRSSNINDLSNMEGTDFFIKLENFMREKHNAPRVKVESVLKGNLKNFLLKSCDAFADAKSEYFQVALQMNVLLQEITHLKEKYSEHLKEKSLVKQGQIEILEKKLHCLKLQSLLKFYGENKALDAHLRLKETLSERLNNLQLQCNNLLELSIKYNDLKNNKTYSELFQIYKQLLKREMKIDYMIEN